MLLIARDLRAAGQLFSGEKVVLLQAPFRHGPGFRYEPAPTFAHLLHNVGYDDAKGLTGLVAGWRNLFGLTRPTLVFADHAPTALLAARSLDLPAITWGTGFCCPPDAAVTPNLMPWRTPDPVRDAAVDGEVLGRMNAVLRDLGGRPLDRVTGLYHDGPRRFLTTFAELDHFPGRVGETYRGCWPYHPGVPPEWPAAHGPRVVAYLKRSGPLPDILDALIRLGVPSLLHVDGADAELRRRYAVPTLRFADRPLDLKAAASEAAVGITHGGHGATTALLLAGLPVLVAPLHLEQLLVAKAVERLGAGLPLPPGGSAGAQTALRRLLGEVRFRDAARGFADRHAGFDPEEQLGELVSECEEAVSR